MGAADAIAAVSRDFPVTPLESKVLACNFKFIQITVFLKNLVQLLSDVLCHGKVPEL